MKIFIITPSFLPKYSGMTFATLQHAVLLTASGFSVTIIADCPSASVASVRFALEAKGITFLPVNLSGSGFLFRPVVGDIDSLLETLACSNDGVLIVEGKYFWGFHLITRFRHIGFKVALISHGSAPVEYEWSFRWLIKSIWYFLYLYSHEYSICRAVNAVGVLSSHIDNNRFRDIPFFWSLGFQPLVVANTSLVVSHSNKRDNSRSPGRLRVAVVGEMSATKNQAGFFDIGLDTALVEFVRFYYPEENSYSRIFRQSAIRRGVSYFQYCVGLDRSRVVSSLRDIDLVLCLSKTEAQPLALIDGLALGIPFLSTPVGCVGAMRGGFVSEVKSMAKIFTLLASDVRLYDTLVIQARSQYAHCHSFQTVGDALVRLVDTAMSAGTRSKTA